MGCRGSTLLATAGIRSSNKAKFMLFTLEVTPLFTCSIKNSMGTLYTVCLAISQIPHCINNEKTVKGINY